MRTMSWLVLMLLLAPLTNAAEWQAVTKSDLLVAHVDVASIQQRGGLLVADVLMDYATEQTANEMPKPYRSIVHRSAYECQLGRTTTITIDVFSGATATGDQVSRSVMEDADSHWLEVPATGMRREIFAFVCARMPPKQ